MAVKYKVKSCIERQSPLPDNPSDDYLEEAMAKDLAQGRLVSGIFNPSSTNPDSPCPSRIH